ncbi:MAG: zinc-ribbon domain-containing protein [Clostridiales bacterium]|jgi:ribosomal protein L40E|nr:zinc-ribbon domain-containing protein [Clostridiales bacterium]
MVDDIKNSLTKFARNVGRTSNELLKSTKLQLSLSNEEEELKRLYTEIGKKVHEIYQYGGSLGKFFDEKYKDIVQQEEKINDLRDQLNIVKGVKTCARCGAQMQRSVVFCPKCGAKVGEDVESAHASAEARETIASDYRPPVGRSLPSDFEPEAGRTSAASGSYPAVPAASGSGIADKSAGKPAPTHKTCRHCGAKNELTAIYCLTCGRII